MSRPGARGRRRACWGPIGRRRAAVAAAVVALPTVFRAAGAQDTARSSSLSTPQASAASARTTPTPTGGRRYRPEIKGVTIRDAHAVSDGDIKDGIATTVSHCRGILYLPFCLVSKAPYFYERHYLDRDELKRDVLRIRVLYWKRGYRLTSVDTAVAPPSGTTARVRFTIHEGPPTILTDVTVTPASLVAGRLRKRMVTLHRGHPLDLNALDTTVLRLQQRLWSRGYSDAVVDTSIRVTGQPPADSVNLAAAAAGLLHGGTADVAITVDPRRPTTVDTVLVRGNERVSAQTIRHTIVLQPHSLFLRQNIQRSQRALYQTSLFRRASIAVDTAPGKPDSAKVVTVTVDEGPSREVEAGAGFTTVDFFSLSGRFTDHNWVGGARQLVLQAGLGNLLAHGLYPAFNNGFKELPPGVSPNPYLSPTWQVAANVTQPWFLAAGNSLGAGVFAHRRVAPGVFVDNAYGGTGTFTHDLSERAPLSLAYRFSVTHVDASDVYFCVDYGVCDAATRSALRARARLSPVSLSTQIDRTDDPLNPMTGFQVRAELQHASQFTVSDFRYNRAYATGSAYRPIGHAVLAFNARIGLVSAIGSTGAAIGDTSGNILHPTVRFYAGGSQSVRGFGENQLGPRVLTIAPEQLRGRVVANGGRDTTYLFCPPPRAIATCDPNASLDTVINGKPARLHLTDNVFSPQPLGGRTLLEGSVEYRFPLFGNFGGAVFVDAGVVGQGNLGAATSGTSAITPGFGVRYYSPVGPIRIDIGLNPLTTERLTVLTEDPTTRSIVVVTGPPGAPRGASDRIYAPARTEGGFQGLLNRISLHLSIGQAF